MNRDHGGDHVGFVAEYGNEPLDFSVNTNPLGMPPAAMEAARAALADTASYPDPECRALRRALAKNLGVQPGQILCGGGAADLIFRLAYAVGPGKVLLPQPSFSEYGRALAAAGCEVEPYFLREEAGFALDADILPRITPAHRLVMLCEPANPTGRLTDSALLRQIFARCEETGTRLFVDECFNEFLDDPKVATLTGTLGTHPGLFILKAFTKFYAMAGLRLGYALCADEALLQKMGTKGPPWAVSNVAQAAGAAALVDDEYPGETRALIVQGRAYLKEELMRMGCRVYDSKANFLFFYHQDEDLFQKLAARGILIRDCANYPGLGPGYYRAAVRGPGDNRRLAETLGQILGEKQRQEAK